MLKLVRVDEELSPPPGTGFPLLPGIHPFGRGVFLDCVDKRVSRQHGTLEVADNVVTLTALHTNPCFVVKKGISGTKILKSGSSEVLVCGDKFSLLPNSHCYELRQAEETTEAPPNSANTQEYSNGEAVQEEDEEVIDFPFDEDMEVGDKADRMESPSLLARENAQNVETAASSSRPGGDDMINLPEDPEPRCRTAPDSPSLIGENVATIDNNSTTAAASKRAYSQDTTSESPTKQARTADDNQLQDVKPSISALNAAMAEATSSTSNGNDGESEAQVKKEVKDEPASPPHRPAVPLAAAPPGRERCMYGARCYRRNPQHKQAYSHPTDADWGTEERGVCPWGAGCTRRDPRHWRDHTHPPGTVPAAAAGPNRGDGKRGKQRRPAKRKDRDQTSSTEDSQGLSSGNILPTKRTRKTVRRESYSGSESENEYDMDDPFLTDESDDWVPSDEELPSDYTQSQ